VGTVAWAERLFRGWGPVAFFALVFAGKPLTAVGQPDPATTGVSTRVDPCVPIELDQFHRVLAIELGTSIEYSADADQKRSLTSVWLSCKADGIELHLEDGLTRKSMTRVVDIARLEPASRSRLLALAVAEFVVASWVELRLPEPPAIEPVGPAPPSSATRIASRLVQARVPASPVSPVPAASPVSSDATAQLDWRLGVTFEVLAFSSALYPVPSAGLHLLQSAARPLAFGLSLQFGHRDLPVVLKDGQSSIAVGDIQLTTLSVLLSVRYVTLVVADLDLSMGAGGRFGVMRLKGSTKLTELRTDRGVQQLGPSSFSEPWGGPALVLGVSYHAGPHLRLVAELETGYVIQGVNALLGDSVLLRIEQLWGAVALGLAWAF
jgi:hypothetical protein